MQERTYLSHGSNGKHFVNLVANTFDLDTDGGSLLNNLVTVVRPLRRGSIRVPLDLRWNRLQSVSRMSKASWWESLQRDPRKPPMSRSQRRIQKERQS